MIDYSVKHRNNLFIKYFKFVKIRDLKKKVYQKLNEVCICINRKAGNNYLKRRETSCYIVSMKSREKRR